MRRKVANSSAGEVNENATSPKEPIDAAMKPGKGPAMKISKEQRVANARKAARARWWRLK
jgi:hypothetical protein